MVYRDGIGHFLARARKRARTLTALRIFALAAIGLAAVVFGMAWLALQTGPAAYWPTITTTVLLIGTLLAAFFGGLLPWSRLKTDSAVALLVGQKYPPLASDLLSAVQLARQVPAGSSEDLVQALRNQVGDAASRLEIDAVVPARETNRTLAVAMGVAILLGTMTFLAPSTLARGLALLVRTPTLYEGASVSDEPLVRDVRITYTYPPYTKLPPKTVEGATGDVQALKGTKVELEMRSLRRARRALLFFGEAGEGRMLEAHLNDNVIRASFVVSEGSRYRIWLAPLLGRPVRERRGHRAEDLFARWESVASVA